MSEEVKAVGDQPEGAEGEDDFPVETEPGIAEDSKLKAEAEAAEAAAEEENAKVEALLADAAAKKAAEVVLCSR